MDSQPQAQRSAQAIPAWFVLAVAILALVVGTAALSATLFGRSGGFSMMGGGFGMMSGGAGMFGGAGMMGGNWSANPANGPQPGEAGFVAGTVAAPRVIRVFAGPGYTFSPSAITVVRGETIAFQVTTMGPATHEFMVGPAGAVAADQEGTPEVDDIGMMQTRSLIFTFDGDGPYAYACHAPGHYEAGMRGAVTVVSS